MLNQVRPKACASYKHVHMVNVSNVYFIFIGQYNVLNMFVLIQWLIGCLRRTIKDVILSRRVLFLLNKERTLLYNLTGNLSEITQKNANFMSVIFRNKSMFHLRKYLLYLHANFHIKINFIKNIHFDPRDSIISLYKCHCFFYRNVLFRQYHWHSRFKFQKIFKICCFKPEYILIKTLIFW